jgi:hypothetical protein
MGISPHIMITNSSMHFFIQVSIELKRDPGKNKRTPIISKPEGNGSGYGI